MANRKSYKKILIILIILSLLAGCGRKSSAEGMDVTSEHTEAVPETLKISASTSCLWFLYEKEQGEFDLYNPSHFSELLQYIEETLSKQVYSYEFDDENDERTTININLTEAQRKELQSKVDTALADATDFLKGELDYFVSLNLGENTDYTLEIELDPERFTEAIKLNTNSLLDFYNLIMLIDLCYLDKSLESGGIPTLEVRIMNHNSGYCMLEYSKKINDEEAASLSMPMIQRSNYQDYSPVTTIATVYQGNVTFHFTDTDVEYSSFLTLDDRYFSKGTTIYMKPSVVPADLSTGSNVDITFETGTPTSTVVGDGANPDGIKFLEEVSLEQK